MTKYQFVIAKYPVCGMPELPGRQKANKYSQFYAHIGIKNPLRSVFEEEYFHARKNIFRLLY